MSASRLAGPPPGWTSPSLRPLLAGPPPGWPAASGAAGGEAKWGPAATFRCPRCGLGTEAPAAVPPQPLQQHQLQQQSRRRQLSEADVRAMLRVELWQELHQLLSEASLNELLLVNAFLSVCVCATLRSVVRLCR